MTLKQQTLIEARQTKRDTPETEEARRDYEMWERLQEGHDLLRMPTSLTRH